MRDWLAGAVIDNDLELVADLARVEYGYAMKDGRDAIQLERKEDMKKRGLGIARQWRCAGVDFRLPCRPARPQHSIRTGYLRI
jgi:hypothetical protein